jgi:hypothetical protein
MPILTPGNAFKDALRFGAILVVARFTVYQKGVPVGSPYEANVSTGTFTVDRNSEFRRTGQLTIELLPTVPPPILMPVNPSSLLAPFGTELFIETGIGSTVAGTPNELDITYIPNGLFVVTTSTVDDTTIDLTVTLDLSDRAWTIAQRALKNPYNFPATPSGNFVTEIIALLNMVWNEQVGVAPLQYNIAPTSASVPTASYNQGSDPWQAALDMATAIGYELYFDAYGVVTGHPVPNPATTPTTWYFTDSETAIAGLPGTGSAALLGDAYSTPVEVSLEMTRSGIFNDVVIQGTGDANAATYTGNGIETSGPPALGEAADTNPASPTYIGGPMGDVPNFVSSSLVTATNAQTTATNDLLTALSLAWNVTLTIPPNPTIDIDDIVSITRPRLGMNGTLIVVDSISQTINYGDTQAITGRVIGAGPTSG